MISLKRNIHIIFNPVKFISIHVAPKCNNRGQFGLSPSLLTHRLVVTATDRGSPRLAGSATLTVIIVDQNDNSPTIPMHQEIRIPESKFCLI